MRPVIDREGRDFESEALVFRTDFSDDAAWRAVVELLNEPPDEFEIRTHVVDDRAFEGAGPDEVRSSTMAADPHLEVAFLADADTMRGEHPLLAVTTRDQEREDEEEEVLPTEFRLLPGAVHLIHVNLAIGHMDYWEFAYHAVREPGRVYRP